MLTPLGCRNQFRCYSQRRSLVDSVRGIFCFVLPFPSCFFFPPPLPFSRSPEPSSPIERHLCLTAASIDSHPRWDTFSFFYLLSARRPNREPAHGQRNGLDCVLFLPLVFLIIPIFRLFFLLRWNAHVPSNDPYFYSNFFFFNFIAAHILDCR